MVIIESLKRNVSRITIFIGDLPPLFFIVYVIYFNTPYSIYTLVVLAVSIAMAFYWKVILNLADDSKDKNVKSLDIENSSDSTTAILGYFLTYTVSVPSISIIGGAKGLIVLSILLGVIYLVLYENRVILYNPFLSLFKYRMYRIQTKDKADGYILIRVAGINYEPRGLVTAVQIDDFFYIASQKKQNAKKL
jgi:hypothetical protein